MNKIKTVIAAGGLGTRLQGFRGNDSTKILLEVDGSPMIIRQIEQLTNWGLNEFIIITNPSFDKLIRDVIGSYFPDKDINFTIIILRSEKTDCKFYNNYNKIFQIIDI